MIIMIIAKVITNARFSFAFILIHFNIHRCSAI
jgi:hypothetical protein